MGDAEVNGYLASNVSSEEFHETNNGSNTTVGLRDFCRDFDRIIDESTKSFFVLSVMVMIGLSFVVRRRNRLRGCCWARPGILQPVNFVDEIGRRWAYAACFVILTYNVMMLFDGETYWNFLPKDNKEWMKKYGWVKGLNTLWEVLSICLVYYPLLACIDHRRSFAANIVGLLYLIPWILMYSTFFIVCPVNFHKGILGIKYHFFRVPINIALYVVGVSYVLDFVKNVMRCRRRCKEKSQPLSSSKKRFGYNQTYKIDHHVEYVSNLLQRKSIVKVKTKVNFIRSTSKELANKVKYEKVFGFRYSTRLICCLTVSVTIILWVMVQTGLEIEESLKTIHKACYTPMLDPVYQLIAGFICEAFRAVRVLSHVANAIAGSVILIFLGNTLITYKRCWHLLLRGDHSWHVFGSRINSPRNTLLNGLKFGGFQVAYAVWGFTVLFAVLWIIFMVLIFGLLLPLKKGENGWILEIFLEYWPSLLLVIIVIPLIQNLVCRFVFLQGKGADLAIDNRRIYNAASYYFLILNIIVGFFSCMKRVLIPLVLGITFLSRLDQPLIMKGYEANDSGYASFVSMLMVDLYHNHPLVKIFVELLLQARERQKILSEKSGIDSEKEKERYRRSKLMRNRWLKCITLMNNPSLLAKFLEKRLIDELKSKAKTENEIEIYLPMVVSSSDGDRVMIEIQPLTTSDENA